MIESYIPNFCKSSDELMEYLENFVDKDQFDLLPIVSKYAIKMLFSSFYNGNLDEDENYDKVMSSVSM